MRASIFTKSILTSLLLAFCLIGLANTAMAQTDLQDQRPERHFHGLYGGLSLSRQNVIAGAQVGGVDMLQQDTRLVTSIFAGARAQFKNHLVIGGEVSFGFGDQELSLDDPANQLQIRYDNANQWSYGGQFGCAFGADRRNLIFAYVSETTRTFDVQIVTAGGQFDQTDEQGLLRYGLGFERQINGGLHGRVSAGSSRADFDSQSTNIDADSRFEFEVAVLYQF